MKTILITGANRGLGLEFTKQLTREEANVIATCRHPTQAISLQELANLKKNLTIIQLDVSDDKSINNLVDKLSDTAIDWLINNAGTTGVRGVTIGNIRRDNVLNVMNVNCLGAIKLSEALLPNLSKSEEKLIINLGSRLGNISNNQPDRAYAYRASKAALNRFMRSFAVDVAELGINIILIDPGWVKTDLGGPQAELDAPISVAGMLKVIEANKKNSHAEILLTYDGKTIAW